MALSCVQHFSIVQWRYNSSSKVLFKFALNCKYTQNHQRARKDTTTPHCETFPTHTIFLWKHFQVAPNKQTHLNTFTLFGLKPSTSNKHFVLYYAFLYCFAMQTIIELTTKKSLIMLNFQIAKSQLVDAKQQPCDKQCQSLEMFFFFWHSWFFFSHFRDRNTNKRLQTFLW